MKGIVVSIELFPMPKKVCFGSDIKEEDNLECMHLYITQSKSKTIITRSMLTISLIVFTDQLQGHVNTFYSK